jgi:hypothetical protein
VLCGGVPGTAGAASDGGEAIGGEDPGSSGRESAGCEDPGSGGRESVGGDDPGSTMPGSRSGVITPTTGDSARMPSSSVWTNVQPPSWTHQWW